MTGLDVFKDTIIEICCIITDSKLNILDAQGFESVIYKPKSVLDSMNNWCIEHHGKSGLTKKVLNASSESKSLEKVEEALLEYIKKYVPLMGSAVLGGNTIHMDKFFMIREFPKVVDHLHYRVIDVSSISEICKRLNPELTKYQPRKKNCHTAKSDILESIGQLKWFSKYYLKSDKEVDFNAVVLGGTGIGKLALK